MESVAKNPVRVANPSAPAPSRRVDLHAVLDVCAPWRADPRVNVQH